MLELLALGSDTESTIRQEAALDALFVVIALVEVEGTDFDLQTLKVPGIPSDVSLEEFPGWTVRLLRSAVHALAAMARQEPEALLRAAVARARVDELQARRRLKENKIELDRERRRALLPASDEIEKISRYEAHLDRLLQRTLHEIQRLQAMRAGIATQPPVAVDVTVASAD